MTELQQGGNVALPAGTVTVRVQWSPERIGGQEVDASAFLLGANGKVRSDEDMVFYNQREAAQGAVSLAADNRTFTLDLARLPQAVEAVSFVATIHADAPGAASFGQATAATIEVPGVARFAAATAGRTEAALILGQAYRRGTEWKFRAVGQGFNGGLKPLAEHFGVSVADEPAAAVAPPASKINLQKRLVDLEKKDPQLVSLVKKLQVQLDKEPLPVDGAKVALVLDISGSMHGLYKSGKIDQLVQRIMALGYQFDDDGAIDVFAFGEKVHEVGAATADDYRGLVKRLLDAHKLEGGTRYGLALERVRQHYKAQRDFGQLPVFVMFVTDGGTDDKAKTEREVRESSSEPFFWKFMAIGAKGKYAQARFDFLDGLDNLAGRLIDNADFFQVEDPMRPSDEEFFTLLMNEYPEWLTAARQHGLVRA